MSKFDTFNINFLKYSSSAFILSAFIIISGTMFCLITGVKKSIDFTGGTVANISIDKEEYDIDFLRKYLSENLDENISIVKEGFDEKNYRIILTMKFLKDEKKLSNTLNNIYSQNYKINMIESIGPKIGDELQASAIKAILTAIIFIGIYISFRFDGYYALGSIAALIHDVIITFVFLMFFQYEISITIIAALLTIVGYSLNDTIVIYDRIRENLKININVEREIVVNKSLNTTLNRTIITSLTTLIVALVLYIFGGEILEPFAMALIVGVLTGTYSSLFVATPLMVILEDKYRLEDLEDEED
tara:strand:- start:1337 stop:2245 length:909 start_codon:yes stop_codon:yes gene_type:complete